MAAASYFGNVIDQKQVIGMGITNWHRSGDKLPIDSI